MTDAVLFLLIFTAIVPGAALWAAIVLARRDTTEAAGDHANLLGRLRGHLIGLTMWTTIKLGSTEGQERKGLAA